MRREPANCRDSKWLCCSNEGQPDKSMLIRDCPLLACPLNPWVTQNRTLPILLLPTQPRLHGLAHTLKALPLVK